MRTVVEAILKELRPGINLDVLKRDFSKRFRLKKILTNIEILSYLNSEEKILYKNYFVTKPTRTISGVVPIAIMSKPIKCPHGKCIMCPGGVDSHFGDIPQSYTGNEPATMRAVRAGYDSYAQVFNRLEQYVLLNHSIEKVELIVMGGTFPSYEKKYRDEFIKYAFKAMNDFSKLFFTSNGFDFVKFKEFFELPANVHNDERVLKLMNKIKGLKFECNLANEQKKNETSKVRCVGLTIETRPDYGLLKEGNEMLRLGCTRVELGIQSVYDDVLDFIERGHTVNDSIKSIQILKDLGFKLNFHYMPGLVDSKKDLEGMKKLFSDSRFRPDMLKIYPCMVMPGTKLYELYKKGKFKPITTKDAAKLISEFKKYVEPYCRIMRVQRDIPSKIVVAGVDKTNLRQYIDSKDCRCIRCREIRNEKINDVQLKVQNYESSNGTEYFISLESNDKLVGFCRLRFSSKCLRKEITKKNGLIRELHVYGSSIGIGESGDVQHRGFGKMLLLKAEEICKEYKKEKMVVIAGVGAREYYKKLGYKKEGPYMSQRLL